MEPHTEREDVENRNKSFRDVIADFMGYTSAHGFGRLVATKSFLWKILWIMGILFGFTMFVLHGNNELIQIVFVTTSANICIDCT